MDEIEVRPQETSEVGEGSERAAAQKLDDATFEPRDYVEQSGNYQQAEAIQTGFTLVVDSVASRADCPIPIPHTAGESSGGAEQVGEIPIPIPRPAEGSGGAGNENLSNINLPMPPDTIRPQVAGSEERDTVLGRQPKASEGPFEKASGEEGDRPGITPINLPGVQSTHGKVIGDSPMPLPRPVEEIGNENLSNINLPMPPDTIRPQMAGSEERDTVLGRQPKASEGPFEKASSEEDDDKENITPINLPNVHDQTRVSAEGIRQVENDGSAFGTRSPGMPPSDENGGWIDGGKQSSSKSKTVTADLIPGGLPGGEVEENPPMPPDHIAGPQGDETEQEWLDRMAAGKSIAGSEERDTVLGRQPKASEGPFEKASGEEGDRPGITPINLPGVRNEGSLSGAPVKKAGENDILGKMDSDTGQMTSPTGTPGSSKSGTTEKTGSQGSPSATIRDTLENRGYTPNEGEFKPYVPPQVEKSAGKGEGSKASLGPQELDQLNNSRFAEQALDAIGMGGKGWLGSKSPGGEGKVSGYGPGAPDQGMPGLPGWYTNKDKGLGSPSSGGGAPVHGYGPGAKGEGPGITFTYYPYDSTGQNAAIIRGAHEQTGAECEETKNAKTGTHEVVCWDENGNYVFIFGYTVEDGNPMPYTGSGYRHNEPKESGIIGGRDKEDDSGNLMPVVSNDGGSGGGGGGGGEPGVDGDDGNWYGTIFASIGLHPDSGGALPIDPDRGNYYTS